MAPDTALVRRAMASEHQGKFTAAARLYRRAVASAPRRQLGAVRLLAWSRLGNLSRLLGRYAEADRYFRRALPLAESLHGPDAEETRTLFNNWAVLHKYQGRFADGARLYRRALQAALAVHGEDHPEVATLYHNLGGREHARGRYAAGEPFARKSVAIRRRLLGAKHPDVAADDAALAAILVGLKQYAEAERSHSRPREFG